VLARLVADRPADEERRAERESYTGRCRPYQSHGFILPISLANLERL
jgi:hypothetical protein